MDSNKVVVIIGGENDTGGVFAEVGGALDGLLEKVGGLSGLLEGLTLEEVLRRFIEFTAQVLESEVGLTRMAASTGIAIEELGGLALAAKMSGVSTEEFEGSLKKFATTLSTAAAGNLQAKNALDSLGISAKDANGNVIGISDALGKVADKFAATKDGTDKAALAVQLFGRQGLDMIPILDKGSKGIAEMNAKAEELHLTLSKTDQQTIKQFDDDLGLLKAAGEGLTEQFLRGLVPALDEIVRAMNDTVGGFDAMKLGGEVLGGLLKVIATVILTIGTSFAWAGEQALAFFGIIQDAGKDLDTRLKAVWTDIWDPAAAEQGAAGQKAALQRVAQDAEAIRKLKLQAEIDGYKQAAQIAVATNALELQNLEETYKAELISVQEYFDKKKALQLESLAIAKTNAQLEANALLEAAAHAPNEKDRLEILRQEAQVTAQISELTSRIFAAQGKNPATGEIDELVQMARQAEIYTAEAKQVGEQIDAVFADLEEKTQAVQTAVEDYQLTALQGETKINALRDQARQKLAGMVDQYGRLALASGDPKLVANADKFEKKVDELAVHIDSMRKEAIQGATQDLESFFTGMLDGTQRGASAFEAFGKALIKTLAEIEAKMIAVWIIQKALGWLSALGGHGASSSLGEGSDEAAFVGIGSHAAGGPVSAGDWSWVGEEGPELVKFGSSATVIPHSASVSMASGGGGDTYYQDFRGADVGMLQQVQNMIRVSEERSVARAKIEFLDMQRRRA